MTCEQCPKRNECTDICEELEELLPPDEEPRSKWVFKNYDTFEELEFIANRRINWWEDSEQFKVVSQQEEPDGDIEEEEIQLMDMSYLTDRQRYIVERFYFDGVSQVDIAKELGIAQPTVSIALKRAIKTMREYYGIKNNCD